MAKNARPVQTPRELQLICGVLVFSNVVFACIAAVLELAQGLPVVTAPFPGFEYLLLLVGLASAGLSFVLRAALLKQVPEPAALQQVSVPIILATGLAEAAGGLGLLVALTTGVWPIAGLLWGIGLGAGILHFPTEAKLNRLLAVNT